MSETKNETDIDFQNRLSRENCAISFTKDGFEFQLLPIRVPKKVVALCVAIVLVIVGLPTCAWVFRSQDSQFSPSVKACVMLSLLAPPAAIAMPILATARYRQKLRLVANTQGILIERAICGIPDRQFFAASRILGIRMDSLGDRVSGSSIAISTRSGDTCVHICRSQALVCDVCARLVATMQRQ